MALAVGDIVQIIDKQVLATEDIMNVYFYEVTDIGTGMTLQDMTDGFEYLLINEMASQQSTDLTHTEVTGFNLTNGLDIASTVTGISGGAGGSGLATNLLAIGIKLNRSTALTRNGSKRIGGVTEADVTGNILAVGVQAFWQGVADRMAIEYDVMPDGLATVGHAIPVIVGRTAGALDLAKINPILSATLNTRLTTQVSRKVS